MATYIYKVTSSDLAPSWPNTSAFDIVLSTGTGTDTNINVSLDASEIKSAGCITPSGVPNNDAWNDGGTQTVALNLDTMNMNIRARCRVVMLNSTGTIIESGSFTAYQTCQANRVFSPDAPTWSTGPEACSNRYAIEWEFEETSGMSTEVIDIAVGATGDDVVSDIDENTDNCAFVPEIIITN